MSETLQDRTEEATPRRRQEAHDKGQVARSTDLTTALLLLAAAASLRLAAPHAARGLSELYVGVTLNAPAMPAAAFEVAPYLRHVGWQAFAATLPLMLGSTAVALGITVAQARGVLSLKPLEPDFSRISPIKNGARIFGPKALVELAKSLFKLIVIGFALYRGVIGTWSQVMSVGQQSPRALAETIAQAATGILFAAGTAYLIIAGADYAWQLWQHEKQLRMTKEEVKQEHKDQEGDPLIKSRIRAIARSRMRKQMFDEVPKADVVVTNPTRIAVALRYDPMSGGAPIVLAMGQRKIAQRIRELALAAGVPIVENKPLARALLATARVGEPIPAELYVAVAEVLAFVIRRRHARADGWAGEATV